MFNACKNQVISLVIINLINDVFGLLNRADHIRVFFTIDLHKKICIYIMSNLLMALDNYVVFSQIKNFSVFTVYVQFSKKDFMKNIPFLTLLLDTFLTKTILITISLLIVSHIIFYK